MTHQEAQAIPLYIVVRGDLAPGYQIAQSAHAIADFARYSPEEFLKWHTHSGYIIALHADDESHLHTLAQDALCKGLSFVQFKEPDLNHQVTSLAFEPNMGSKRFLSNLRLAGRNNSHAVKPENN